MTKPSPLRIALVTGASTRHGYATARARACAAHMSWPSRAPKAAREELDDEIRKDGGSATLVPPAISPISTASRGGARR
jgi:NAD(P)-dependent dehydrogenase (short-subunit alcohol dehydrogenase family)